MLPKQPVREKQVAALLVEELVADKQAAVVELDLRVAGKQEEAVLLRQLVADDQAGYGSTAGKLVAGERAAAV